MVQKINHFTGIDTPLDRIHLSTIDSLLTIVGGSMNSLRINLAGRGAAPSLELTTRLVDHVRRTLNPNDFDMQAVRDITAAVGTLASYGLLSPDS